MKVFIITQEPFPYGMAATKRILCYAKGLQYCNLECEVLITKRPFSVKNGNLDHKFEGIFDGVKYKYFSSSPFRSRFFIKRRIDDFIDAFYSLLYCVRKMNKGDVFLNYLRSSPLNYFVIIVAQILKTKVITDLCEYPYVFGKQSKFNNLCREIQFRLMFPLFDGFIAISETLCEVANHYKSSNARVFKIPILVDCDNLVKSDIDLKKFKPYLFHSGSLSEQKDGFLGILDAFILASKVIKINFLITGNLDNAPNKNIILKKINDSGLKERIFFLGYISNEHLKAYQDNALLSVINKYPTLQNKYCFATKIGEYLFAGIPVVTTNVGEAALYLKDRYNAFVVEPNKPELIAGKIVYIFNNPDESKAVSQRGKELALSEFNYKVQGKKLLSFLKTI